MPLRAAMKQTDEAVDWSASTADLMPNLRTGDSSPGVADIIDSDRIYLFAAHEDDYLDGKAGTILGDRHGAICRATGDGAIWIERAKPALPVGLKLPAAQVLGARHRRLPTSTFPPMPTRVAAPGVTSLTGSGTRSATGISASTTGP